MRIKDKRWTVGITDFVKPPITSEVEAFPEAEFIFLSDWRESDENKKQWQTVDAILVWHWVVDTQTAAVLDNCKIAVRYGMGYDRVDIQALADKNIVFCNTPGCGTTEVADTACAMILGLQRKIIGYNYDCRRHMGIMFQKPHALRTTPNLPFLRAGIQSGFRTIIWNQKIETITMLS